MRGRWLGARGVGESESAGWYARGYCVFDLGAHMYIHEWDAD